MSQRSLINPTISNIYSLTPMQEGMLYHKLANGESTSYVIQNRFEVRGDISEDTIKQALKLLFIRHEVLKTSIVFEKLEAPRQVILRNREAEYERIDLSEWCETEQIRQLEEVARQDVERGFDLQRDSLLRIKLIALGHDKYKMIWTYHHIIMDGWCLSLLYGDFKRYYDLLRFGRSMGNLELMIAEEKKWTAEYGDYLQWLEKQDKELGLSYWEEMLADYGETADIKPIEKPEPVAEHVAQTRIRMSKAQTKRLLDLASSNHVTINTVTEAAWGIVLQAYSGTKDVVFGKIVSGRHADVRGIERIVGLFISTIPTRVRCNSDTIISELLKELQVQGMKGNEYSYCPFPRILELTKQKSDLVKVLYVFENYEFEEALLADDEDGIQLKFEMSREKVNYGISLIASLEEGCLNLKIMYDPNEFVKDEIESILFRMESVLSSFTANPEGRVSAIETITGEEKARILGEFNDTAVDYPRDRTVVELFEEQVRQTPDRTAVVFQEDELTYAALNQAVNQVAWKLRELGVGPDDRVAILAERGIEMIAGIFGIMKAGGAYVPIDPTFPEERIRFMLEDCRPKAVLLYKAELETELPVLDLADHALWEGKSDNPGKVNKPEDLAYVIYTSGTTGQPKGVMLQHRGVVAMRTHLKELYQVTEEDNVLQFANYVFDAAVWEMTLSLLLGAKLTLIPKETAMDAGSFNAFVKQSGITLTLLPPQFYLQTELTGLKALTTGGSASNAEIIEKAGRGCRYVNAYGPTENTVLATNWEYDGKSDIPYPVPIGKPIANTQVYILNGMNLCGIGIPGELCIAGDGVARGYLNRPELTAEKFIPNPYGEGKLYRSGDLARWLPDGNIEYMGRIDEQVKIRGFRIELGEIESALRKLEHIADAAVITRNDHTGDKAVHGYVVSDLEIDAIGIKEALKGVLPEYMIPSFIMQIDSIPVTRSGKLDKNALPMPDLDLLRKTNKFVPAQNECEHELSVIWKNILNFNEISIHDNFFDLGGNSLLITVMLSQIEERSLGTVKVGDVFANPTIAQLAAHIEASSLGTLRCTQVPFPGSYFKQSNKGLHDSVFTFTDEGSLFQSIKAMHAANESELYARLLFGYSYLMFDATDQQELTVCTVNQKEYTSFNVKGEEDLNVLMNVVRQKYQDAPKFQKAKVRIESKEKGLIPIFLYQFNGSEFYKDFSDFCFSFHLGEESVTFTAEIFNKKISEAKVEELLRGFVQIVKYLTESV